MLIYATIRVEWNFSSLLGFDALFALVLLLVEKRSVHRRFLRLSFWCQLRMPQKPLNFPGGWLGPGNSV